MEGAGAGDPEKDCLGEGGAETMPAPPALPSAPRTSKKKTRRLTTAAKRARGLLRQSWER